MAKSQVFGLRCDASLASYDHQSSSWKMSQLSLFEDYPKSLGTLPRCGMMQNGALYPLETLELPTCENAGFALPTPTATDYGYNQSLGPNATKRYSLQSMAKMGLLKNLPTPVAHEARLGYQRRDPHKKSQQQSLTTIIIDGLGGREKVIGQLNPAFVEWLMGFPIGHTDCEF